MILNCVNLESAYVEFIKRRSMFPLLEKQNCIILLNLVKLLRMDVLEMLNVHIFNIKIDKYVKPINVNILMSNVPDTMQIDTGAGISCNIPFSLYEKYFLRASLEANTVQLKYYNGPIVRPKGQIKVKVKVGNTSKKFSVMLVEGTAKALLGRDIFTAFNLSLLSVDVYFNDLKISSDNFIDVNDLNLDPMFSLELNKLLQNFRHIFDDKLGKYKDEKIHLEIEAGMNPIFKKPHQIPFVFRQKVLFLD